MPYVHRTIRAGRVVEHRKMYSSRVHTKGVKREAHHSPTAEIQKSINERVAEEKLRWKLNANFEHQDYHVVLHYFDKARAFEQCRKDLKLFLKRLRRLCADRGIVLKYIAVTETKRMTNIHHHIICNRIDDRIIADAWEGISGTGGISLRPMDKRGNHYKLASYLMKESRSTMDRYREEGLRGKRYSTSQNLITPDPEYKVIKSSSWRKAPKAQKGATLYKFDDGSTYRSGYHEESGYSYQEYFEVYEETAKGDAHGDRHDNQTSRKLRRHQTRDTRPQTAH